MLEIYKNFIGQDEPKQIQEIEDGAWINISYPTEEELEFVAKKANVPVDYLRSALDAEETSRIEQEESNLLVILDIPFLNYEGDKSVYETYPLVIVRTESVIITVCLKTSKILEDFKSGRVKSFCTFKRSRFMLQILYRIATYYLIYLRQIDKKSVMVENRLHKSMKNKELIQLLSLEKSLVYFSTSLKSNEITLEKLMKMKAFIKYEEDEDILEDVIIENKQAIEMANIYSNILSGTMDAFASVISNNLNIVMKFLATITIVLTIPNIFSGFFGMNVGGIPFKDSPFGFAIVIAIVIVVSVITTYILNKKDMF